MPYIGTDINYGNLAKQTGTGDGADTTPIAALTYTVPSSESILVFLDGVCQVPSTDFTATGTTLTFTTAPANGVAILVMFLGRSLDIGTPADNTVTNAKMANNAIDSAELVAGSVDLAHMSSQSVDEDNLHISNAGSNGDFLSKQSGDAGGLTWAAAGGGAWTLIQTYSLASNTSGVTKTGLDTTYGKLAVVLSDLKQDGDGNYLFCRMGDSGGLDTAVGDYDWFEVKTNTTATSFTAAAGAVDADPNSSFIRVGHGYGNATGEHFSAMLYVNKNSIANDSFCSIHGTWVAVSGGGESMGGYTFGTWRKSATMDRIQFYPSAGAFVSGRISIYGISHT